MEKGVKDGSGQLRDWRHTMRAGGEGVYKGEHLEHLECSH